MNKPANYATATWAGRMGLIWSDLTPDARAQAIAEATAATTGASTPPINPTTGSSSMDLGSIITTLGTQYISSKYGPAPAPTITRPISTQPALMDWTDAYDFFTDDTGTVVATKPKCKRRRRRRRLATVSDIRDLAALKSVLGNGDSFKTWIATHSR